MNIFKFFFFGKAILFLVRSALDVWTQFSYIRNSLREAKWIKQNWAKYHPFGSYAKFFWKIYISYPNEIGPSIIHLVRTRNFSENFTFLTPLIRTDMHTHLCVRGLKKVY